MGICDALNLLGKPVVLPLHPRTVNKINEFGIILGDNIIQLKPANYLDMIKLQSSARGVLTDSGGVQKEAYYLQVPCVTLREETEWIETVKAGWNTLAGARTADILEVVRNLAPPLQKCSELYGDGTTAKKIVGILAES